MEIYKLDTLMSMETWILGLERVANFFQAVTLKKNSEAWRECVILKFKLPMHDRRLVDLY